MGIMVYSLLWVMQDFVHQPYGAKIAPGGRQKPSSNLQGTAILNEENYLNVERVFFYLI